MESLEELERERKLPPFGTLGDQRSVREDVRGGRLALFHRREDLGAQVGLGLGIVGLGFDASSRRGRVATRGEVEGSLTPGEG